MKPKPGVGKTKEAEEAEETKSGAPGENPNAPLHARRRLQLCAVPTSRDADAVRSGLH
jgi:hypothetical protein